MGVASIGGFLFAVGGECEGSRSYEPTQYLESVECYDPKTNTWSEKEKMSQPRSFAAVAVLNGELLDWNNIHVRDIVYYKFVMVTGVCVCASIRKPVSCSDIFPIALAACG